MNIHQQMNLTGWLTLIILSIIWGGSFFFVGVAVSELGTFTIVMLRVTIGALCLWIYITLIKITIPLNAKLWLSLLSMGLLNNVIPFSLIVWAQSHITSSLASILNATTPFFTVIVAGTLIKDEFLNRQKVLGMVVGFCGVIVLVDPASLKALGDDVIAQLAILGSSLSYGFAAPFGRRFRNMNIDPRAVATGQLICSSVILILMAFVFDEPTKIIDSSLPVLLSIFALALISTSFAYILYFRLLSSSGAINISLVTLLVPVSAIFLGITILNGNTPIFCTHQK